MFDQNGIQREAGTPRRRVLIVDDSANVRSLLRTRISRTGDYEVVDEARDGAEAIVMATRHQPDLIILDVMMPVLSGIEALPDIAKGSPGSKIVIYSASTRDRAVQNIHDCGAHAVVNKSAPLEDLLSVMAEVLEHR